MYKSCWWGYSGSRSASFFGGSFFDVLIVTIYKHIGSYLLMLVLLFLMMALLAVLPYFVPLGFFLRLGYCALSCGWFEGAANSLRRYDHTPYPAS